jgi:predicted Zn-dependent protease
LDLIIFFINTHAKEAAQKALQAAREMFPASRKLALVEAISYALAGHPRRAYESLQEMEKHWPPDALQATVSGLAASFMGDRTAAAAEMKKAIGLGATDPLPYYYLGLFESQSPNPDLKTALGWVEKAIARDPDFAWGHLLRGELLLKLGKPAEALKSLHLASRLEPNASEPHYLLGRVYQKLGELEQSEQELKESERLRLQAREAELGGAERQLLVRIQTGP